MRFFIATTIAALMAFGLVGCSDGGSSDVASVQFIHASPNAPDVDGTLDGVAVVENLKFGEASEAQLVDVRDYDVAIEALLPADRATVIGPVPLALERDKAYTILAIGDVATIAPLVLEKSSAAIDPGLVRVQVVHGAFDVQAVDVYVTAPTVDLGTATALGSFSFGGILGPVVIDSGEYRIRVTLASTSTVVYDSGAITLPSQGDLVVTAINKQGAGASPIDLLVSDEAGSTVLQDVNTDASLRLVHASPDAPNVDIIVNDDFANPLVSNLAYGEFTPFVSVGTEAFQVKVVETGTTGPAVIDATLDLEPGEIVTILAAGPVSSIAPAVYPEDRRGVATEARLRLTHSSPSAGPVDIYLTAPGTNLTTVEPNFSNVSFGVSTGLIPVAAGTYEVTVTPTGSTTPAIGPLMISLEAESIYTAIARDAAGGGSPLGLILLDDFLP